ncbi:MAG: ATP-dependent DNA helicase [Bacteroidetes bacterium SW_9_63_38]|nr:MAG: ATP-dependent DNA helicase [Bacteroidetes bacterium SW_9_63_38]
MPDTPLLPDATTRRRIGPWQPDRLAALSDFEPDTNFLVRAAAGSGKTTALIGRMVSLVRTGVPLDDCAAITFTRKAASEMRARLYHELQTAQRRLADNPDASPAEIRRVTEAIGVLPRCFIGTIHAFCARLLRERPLDAGLPPDFTAGLDDREHEEQRRRVWQSYLADVWDRDPERVKHVVSLGIEPSDLVHFFGALCRYPDLTPYVDGPTRPPDLKDAVGTLRGKVEAWMPALPDNPADGDAKPGTTASAVRKAARMLALHPMEDPAAHAAFIGLFDDITKTDSRKSTDTTVRGDLTKSHWRDGDLADALDNEILPRLHDEVVAPALRRWRAYAHRQLVEFVRPAVTTYAEHRRRTGQLTFQDLLACTRDLLRDHPEARRSLQEQYPRLLVDEFQDTDPIQAELLFYLSSADTTETDWRACRPRDGSLFIVGDDKQSIYRFRRADLDVYSAVRTVLDDAPNGEDVTLESNFRSTAPVLKWCNDAFDDLFGRLDAPHQADYVPFSPARTDAPDAPPVLQLEVPYVKGSSSTRKIAGRNAEQVARLIAAACRSDAASSPTAGATPEDFMLLTRNTTRLDVFAEALAAQHLPYTMAGGDDVSASTELHALVTLLTCIERPRDGVARLAYLRGPLVGLSDDALYRLRASGAAFDGAFEVPNTVADGLAPALADRLAQAYDHLRDARARLSTHRPAAAVEQILDRLGLMARTRRTAGLGSLHAGRLLRVLDEVRRLDAEGHPWTAIRDELQKILDGDRSLDGLTLETGAADAVRLLNVHKAKGLEAPVVFLADPYGGAHPKPPEEHVRRDAGDVVLPVYEHYRYHRALRFAPERWSTEFQNEEAHYQRAEEDRLLYVAATRAEDQLIVSHYHSPSWSQEKGYWAPLVPHLEDVPTVEVPSPSDAESDTAVPQLPEVFDADRRDQIEAPTFDTASARDVLNDGLESTGAGYGRDLGSAVHDLLEHSIRRRHQGPPPDAERAPLLNAAVARHEVPNQRDTAARLWHSLFESPLWTAITQADTVHTEYPVAGLVDGTVPIHVRGSIDLLYRRDGAWHIVDFKTDRLSPDDVEAVRKHYRPQLQQYATLWESATETTGTTLALWLADLGQSVRVPRPPTSAPAKT